MEYLLLLLVLLACPLAMWFMMRSMHGKTHEGAGTDEVSRMREKMAILEEETVRARKALSGETGQAPRE